MKVDFTTWKKRDPDEKYTVKQNIIEWKSLDGNENRGLYKQFEEGYFANFQHTFKVKFSKIVTKSKGSRVIIVLWDCRNNGRNRIWIAAQYVDNLENKWKIVINENVNGKLSILFDGIKTYDINSNYFFIIKRHNHYIRLKTSNLDDQNNILEDSGELNCSNNKYNMLCIATIKKLKKEIGKWSTGSIEDFEMQEIHEKLLQINSIRIKNYRPISEFFLDEIRPITIFVGRNNTGKSAILEGIVLATSAKYGWYDSLAKDVIALIIEKRGGWNYADTMIKINEPEAIINIQEYDSKSILMISKNILSITDESNKKLAYDINEFFNSIIQRYGRRPSTIRSTEGIRRQFEPDPIIEEKLNQLKENSLNYFNLFLEYKNDLSSNIEYVAIADDKFFQNITQIMEERIIGVKNIFRSSEPRRSNTTFLLTTSLDYLKELQQRLAINGELLNLIKSLKEKIYYFEDIRQIDNKFLIFFKGINRPLPIESTGDGFKAELSIFSAIATMNKGIIIMEEPEIRLHPGFLYSIVKEIIKTAEEEDIQYFISTHSSEFIEFLLDENPGLIKIIRMYREDISGEIDYEIFTGEKAIEEIDQLKLDLRGI